MPFVIWVNGLVGRSPGSCQTTESSCPLPCLTPSPVTIGHDLVFKGPEPDATSFMDGQSARGTTAACNAGQPSQTDSRKQQHDRLQTGSMLNNPSSSPTLTPLESKQENREDGQRIIDTFTNFSDSVHWVHRDSNATIKFRTINQPASPNAPRVRLPTFGKRKTVPEAMNIESTKYYSHLAGDSVFVCDESGRIRAKPPFHSKATFSRYPPSAQPFCRSFMPGSKLTVPTALGRTDPAPCRDSSSSPKQQDTISDEQDTIDHEMLQNLIEELLDDRDVRGQRSGLQPYVEDDGEAGESYSRPTAEQIRHHSEGKNPAAVPARQGKKSCQDVLSQSHEKLTSTKSSTASLGYRSPSSTRSDVSHIALECCQAKIEDMKDRQRNRIEEMRSLLKTWNAANPTELVADADESSATEMDKEADELKIKRSKAYCKAFLRKARELGLQIEGIWDLPMQSRVERIRALFQDAIPAEDNSREEGHNEALSKDSKIADGISKVDVDYMLREEGWELLE